MKNYLTTLVLGAGLALTSATTPVHPTISGDYLETRSCDVYTGPCFANAEVGLTGKEGILVWSIREGSWQGVSLQGLTVIAALKTDSTLGDVQFQPRQADAVLIVDSRATTAQQKALVDFARTMGGSLVGNVADIRSTTIEANIGGCAKAGCAKVKAGDLVEISTRCLGGEDHLCGNEETYYPPLTTIENAHPAYTEIASFAGKALDLTWATADKRSAFIGTFAR